jgi:hypothetical protein
MTGETDKAARHAIYLDSPVVTALQQIAPYFDSGIFDTEHCPVYMRRRALVSLQRAFTKVPRNMRIHRISGVETPEEPGAVLFYPFNAQSNMNAVTFRQFHHVLTLHGESDKLASFRPAARLYDYVCVAGPLAIDRYLENGIFTREDVDGGRLIEIGDSFVQRLDWLAPASASENDGVLLYCPTWEGFGSQTANYSSIVKGVGFEHVAQVAKSQGIETVVVKPHPYLGMLRPWMWQHFIQGVRALRDHGLDVRLAMGDVTGPRYAVVRLALARFKQHIEDNDNPLPVRLAVTDVSGMEAVLLVAGIPALVVDTLKQPVPKRLAPVMTQKMLHNDKDTTRVTAHYVNNAETLDAQQRAQLFSYRAPSLRTSDNTTRMAWLTNYVRQDHFWGSRERRKIHVA